MKISEILPDFNEEGLVLGAETENSGNTSLGGNDQEPYAEHLTQAIRLAQSRKDEFVDFSGSIVVDLGAGETPFGYITAAHNGARAYIGVELHKPRELNRAIEGEVWPEIRSIPRFVIGEDMETALERFPNDSVSVLASGIIDHFDFDYLASVAQQVERVLSPDGMFLSFYSRIDPRNLVREESMPGLRLVKYTKS